MYVQRVHVSVCVCNVLFVPCPYSSQVQQVEILPSDKCGCRAFPFSRTQIVCKCPALFVFSTRRVFPRHRAGKSVRRRWLALRVNRVLYPAKSKVAEFYVNSSAFCPTPLWIFICMWTHCVVGRGTQKEGRCGCGLKVFFSWLLTFNDRGLLFQSSKLAFVVVLILTFV